MTLITMEKGVKHKSTHKKWGRGEKRRKVLSKKEELYKPPTNEELNSLKQSEVLFHSSLFRLQIEELLNEVKVNKTKISAVSDYVESLTTFLSNLEEEKVSNSTKLNDVLCWSEQVKLPLCQMHPVVADSSDFVFKKPKNVQVSGGYALGLATRPNVNVDLVVEMPKEMFVVSDCTNHGYHRKRASYLVCLARKLKENKELCDSLQFTYFHGDFLKPVLLLKPNGKLLKRFTFVILPCPPRNAFKLRRFVPRKSNIKSSPFFQKTNLDSVADLPTPKYNTSLLVDLTFAQTFQFSISTIGDSDNVRDGIMLLKVWLHQRELDEGLGSFSPFIATMYVVYLLQTKKLNVLMSSYQIARSVWLNLKQSDWSVEGITLAKVFESGKQPPTLVEFHDAFEVVFVDHSGYVNLCANMSKVTYQRVRYEAELALDSLDNSETNSFNGLFMTSLSFLRKFDHLIYVHGAESLKTAVKKCNLEPLLVDNCGNYAVVILPRLVEYLKSGLGARIKFLDIQLKPPPKWSVDENPPSVSDSLFISIGLLLDPALSLSILDKGPAADSSEAVAFKQFWGNKSELRRFHDSSICEAVVWPGESISERRMVCQHVARYILESFIGISGENIRYVGGGLDELLGIRFPKNHEYEKTYGTGEEQTVAALKAYDLLVKHLRNLDDFPLRFSSIQGTSPLFRYTEVFPQLPVKSIGSGRTRSYTLQLNRKSKPPPYLQSLTVIMQLEASSKWPHDLEAILHMKAAFYVKLAKVLRKKFSLLCTPYAEHVHVFKDGYVFRLVFASSHELVALKMIRDETGVVTSRDTKESVELEIMTGLMPKLTSSLHGLQMQHGSFSSTCRLAKRWIASQLLSDHVPDTAIELIVAQLFLSPFPFTPPSGPQVGFLRFLQLLINHDWKNIPFVVNLNEEFKKGEFTEIHNFFVEKRSSLPPMFIATPYDKFDSLLTKQMPTLQIKHRLILLATETLKTLEDQLFISSVRFNPKVVFRPPLEPYDVIIHLSDKNLTTTFMGVDSSEQDAVTSFGENANDVFVALPVVDYNPVMCYLKELRSVYGYMALFFYDTFGGMCIGVLFKPDVFRRKPFKIANINGTMASKANSKNSQGVDLIPNVQGIVEDFRIIGRGLVRHIVTNEDRWDLD